MLKYIDLGKIFDLIQSKASRLIISGFDIRAVLGIIAFNLGVIYLWFGFFVDINTLASTYQYQAEIVPLWVYGIMFLLLGIGTLSTNNEKYRLTMLGRNIAVFGMSLLLLFNLTFLVDFAISAFAVYPILSYAYFCEAFTNE